MPEPQENSLPDHTSPAYAAKVETDLAALQNAHRLALHQWEAAGFYGYPKGLLEDLKIAPEGLQGRLWNNNYQCSFSSLISMSLLPSATSLRSIQPHAVESGAQPVPGYIFNLNQAIDYPARVVLASARNMASGTSNKNKKLNHTHNDIPGELQTLYAEVSHPKHLPQLSAERPDFSALQLDTLGRHIESTPKTTGTSQSVRCEHNEILVAACREHIAAISVPVFDQSCPPSRTYNRVPVVGYAMLTEPDRQALRELQAALVGLEHERKGIDVPVVFYHVSGSNHGQITFFAQGKQMLTEKACAAIRHLQQAGIFCPAFEDSPLVDLASKAVKRELRLDIFKDLAPQLAHKKNTPSLFPTAQKIHEGLLFYAPGNAKEIL